MRGSLRRCWQVGGEREHRSFSAGNTMGNRQRARLQVRDFTGTGSQHETVYYDVQPCLDPTFIQPVLTT